MALPPSLVALRDLPAKLALPPDLEAAITAYTARPPPAAADERAAVDDALALVDRSLAFMDAESARLTEARFAAGDPNALRQRALQEPRRQVDGQLNALKQKLAGEKQEWGRRLQKQFLDVNEQFGKQAAAMTLATAQEGRELGVTLHPEWLGSYERWLDGTLTRWAEHVETLVAGKALSAAEPELRALAEVLGGAPPFAEVRPDRIRVDASVASLREASASCEVPSTGEVIFESFKGGLNTVAMIAGMIVIPVVGSAMHAAPTEMRALVMGGMVVPVIAFAVLAGGKTRRKLKAANLEKAKEKLRKELDAHFKLTIDRFRPEAERYVAAQLASVQQALLAAIEPAVSRAFEERERALAGDLARSAIAADRISEQLNGLRMARGSLATQTSVDLKRRQRELAGA
jgi:hypothetical protein